MAQVARTAEVDVPHRVVKRTREDREEVEVLRILQAAQKVTNTPMSFVKARATVTLCSATPFGTLD